jgi:hypothetical protein
MSWNYRVVKEKDADGENIYSIHEVYYDENYNIKAIGESSFINSDSLEGLKWQISKMDECLKKEVIDNSK